MEKKLMRCVELICLKGCQAVRADIATLERGEAVEETLALADEERYLVLQELREIMAIYGDSCRIDGKPLGH